MPIDNKKMKKVEESRRRRKPVTISDSESDSSNSDSSSEEELSPHEYKKFLSQTFPSKYKNKQVKDGEKIKKLLNPHIISKTQAALLQKKKSKRVLEEKEDEESLGSEDTYDSEEEETDETYEPSDETDESEKPKKKSKKRYESEEDDDSEDDEEEDEKPKSNKYNIILHIGKKGDDYDDDDEQWEDISEGDEDINGIDTEDEDEPVSSSDEEDEDDDDEDVKKSSKMKKIKDVINDKTDDNTDTKTNEELLVQLKEVYEKNKKNKSVLKCIEICEKEIKLSKAKKEKKEKKHKEKNSRIFRKIIRDKNTNNDFDFFEKMEIENQKKIIKELREINKVTRIEKPYRMTLLESNIPTKFKAAAMKKINSLRNMEPGSGEYYKIKNWVDTFMRMPFDKFENLSINIEDGVDKCHDFMENAQKTLDAAVYGLNDAKMQIMQMLGQLITNPKSIGTAIAIHGPPGTGKTSLVKEGISKILNRPFTFIALGGATDSSFLEGHSYTYEGSTWGKIVQILIDSKCMNPVIYFDELDKISDTPKGEEITGILTHLTDTSQNSQFHDKYFAEIDFDLSKCLFIFSYNDESKVNPILKDRMYRIQTKGYNQKQKTVISNNYLLPRIREQVRFNTEDIIIPEDTIHHLIDTYCNKEDGVRNLKRCLEIVHTKLNLYRLMKPGSNLFEEDMALKVEFPFTVTKSIVDKLVKKDKDVSHALYSMYA
jgi:ATP-dependent Lon protease